MRLSSSIGFRNDELSEFKAPSSSFEAKIYQRLSKMEETMVLFMKYIQETTDEFKNEIRSEIHAIKEMIQA